MSMNSDNITDALFNEFTDSIIIADTERRIIKVNASFTKLFGYTSADVAGSKTLILYDRPEDFHLAGQRRFNTSVERNEETYVVRYRKQDGKTFLGQTVGIPIKQDDTVIGFMATIRDISERRRFDDIIYEFQKIVTDNALSLEYKIAWILKNACVFYGLDVAILSEIAGDTYTVKNVYSENGGIEAGQSFPLGMTYCAYTVQQEDVVAVHEAGNSLYKSHPCYQKFRLETYIGVPIKVDGRLYGTLNFSSPRKREKPFTLREKDIARSCAHWISYALTRERHLVEVENARQKAEDANRAKTAFIANISHEVRTPLNGIMGYADILSNMIDDPDIRKISAKIQKSAHNLLDILNDVIDISKIELGKFSIVRNVYSPKGIVEEASDLFRATAQTKNIDLITKIDPSLPDKVIGDDTRIKQVIHNLLGNALKFTDNGQVKISAYYDRTLGHIKCMVADTGIGIADEKQAFIFNDFVQADSGVTKRYGGTGLGLSICKKLIEAMGGKIKLDSKLGLGTTVTFFVPAILEEDTAPSVSPQQLKPTLKKRSTSEPLKVLLVEDIPMNVEIASAMLHRLSCDVNVCMNGADAIRKTAETAFDLIFLDIQMPDIDGITVAKHIRKAGIPTPIIALTAHVMAHEIAEFKASGMNGYLSKPILFDRLKSTIEEWTA